MDWYDEKWFFRDVCDLLQMWQVIFTMWQLTV